MNKLKVQQTGGFPLTTNTLDFMQASLLLMQELGKMGGDLTILSGCETNGNNVTGGVVYINGEILPFVGGLLGENVVIQETRTAKAFEDGIARDVEIVRVAKFGNGQEVYPWSEFEKLMPIKQLQKALTPIGLIAMWSGAPNAIPSGWYLCDGTNDTPNLSNKFVRGFDAEAYVLDQNNNNMGATGGTDDVTPAGQVSYENLHVNISNTGWGASSGGPSPINSIQSGKLIVGSGQPEHAESLESLRGSTQSKTARVSHGHTFTGLEQDNRPDFYTLAFIIFKGE